MVIPVLRMEFNPNLVGYALGDTSTHNPASQFNVAESGSFSRDMPFMARSLINRIVNDPRVDINKHWKLITLFIGAFDFCNDICWDDPPRVSLDHHKADIIETLRILKKNLPRTLIALVPPPHLKTLVETTGKSKLCALTTNFNCPCLLGLAWRYRRQEFYETMRRWLSIDEDIGTYSEFQTEEFAVVVQPFTTDIKLPRLANGISDYRYLSADCFHLSPLGNARTAFSLWRNLIEPVGRKTRSWDEPVYDVGHFPCPTMERPYNGTLYNSYNSWKNSSHCTLSNNC
ncbi:phospholipase B1, membrane-associated-like [Diachasma alloeum]|uniref:phospholipase B1, membrane-associated-like n=1 Tax=Diachasma alloeum TaxID=454923 RepID=UPI000738260B|nr:phospholipase B1, membrane-associated-like [Diachasma alloeum]